MSAAAAAQIGRRRASPKPQASATPARTPGQRRARGRRPAARSRERKLDPARGRRYWRAHERSRGSGRSGRRQRRGSQTIWPVTGHDWHRHDWHRLGTIGTDLAADGNGDGERRRRRRGRRGGRRNRRGREGEAAPFDSEQESDERESPLLAARRRRAGARIGGTGRPLPTTGKPLPPAIRHLYSDLAVAQRGRGRRQGADPSSFEPLRQSRTAGGAGRTDRCGRVPREDATGAATPLDRPRAGTHGLARGGPYPACGGHIVPAPRAGGVELCRERGQRSSAPFGLVEQAGARQGLSAAARGHARIVARPGRS